MVNSSLSQYYCQCLRREWYAMLNLSGAMEETGWEKCLHGTS